MKAKKLTPLQQQVMDILREREGRHIRSFITGFSGHKWITISEAGGEDVEDAPRITMNTFDSLVNKKALRIAARLGPFEMKWVVRHHDNTSLTRPRTP